MSESVRDILSEIRADVAAIKATQEAHIRSADEREKVASKRLSDHSERLDKVEAHTNWVKGIAAALLGMEAWGKLKEYFRV